MATREAKNGLVKVGGVTVAEITKISWDESANLIPDNNLNSTSESHKVGRTKWTATLECAWDPTDTTGQGAMSIGAEVSVEFQPEGAGTGLETVTGTATITGKSRALEEEARITQSFSLEGKGALVYGTQ